MKKNRLILVGVAILIAIMAFTAGTVYGAGSIRLVVNGKDIAADVPPFISGGRTFVPIRFVADALGYPVSYDGKTKTVFVGVPPEGADLTAYDISVNAKSFSLSSPGIVGGVKYSKGYKLTSTVINTGKANFNLSGHYGTVTFSLGVDDSSSGKANVLVYGDGEEIGTFDIKDSDLLKDFTLGVSGVKQISITNKGGANIDLINVRGLK